MRAREISFSPLWLITKEHPSVDFKDAFCIQLPGRIQLSPSELAKLFFECIPRWAKFLLTIREALAKLIGLKTATAMDVEKQIAEFTGEPGQSIALFHVRAASSNEVLTGEDDKHLNFSLSFITKEEKNQTALILATTVRHTSWLGRVYFFFVKPFHRLLVPAMLNRIGKKLNRR